MKVLVWCCGFTDRFAGHFVAKEAERQGHNVRVCGSRGEPHLMSAVFEAYKPDVVFCFAIMGRLLPYYEYIRASGAKLVFWYPDMTESRRDRMWRTQLNNIADGSVFSILETAQRYKDLAKTVVWMPQYFDHRFCSIDGEGKPFNRLDSSKPIYDICFIGSCDTLRKKWLDRLSKRYSCAFFMDGIRRRKEIRGSKMSAIYAQSKIAINIQRELFINSGSYVTSNRVYNAMGSGAFFINHKVTDFDRAFNVGVDCEMHDDTFDNLINKIDYYLHHTALREDIARRGQIKIMKYHTLEKRIPEYWRMLKAIHEENLEGIDHGNAFGLWSLEK